MGAEKEQDIRELVEVLKKLNPLQLMLVQNSAKTLQSYEQMTKRKEIDAKKSEEEKKQLCMN